MTYSPLQLSAIRIFGKKDLSFGVIFTGNEYKNNDLSEEFYTEKFARKSDSGKSYGTFCIASDGKEYEIYEILGHEPHYENILNVLYENDIGVLPSGKYIVLEFLNEKDYETRFMELEYEWCKSPLEQNEKVLKELIQIVENLK